MTSKPLQPSSSTQWSRKRIFIMQIMIFLLLSHQSLMIVSSFQILPASPVSQLQRKDNSMPFKYHKNTKRYFTDYEEATKEESSSTLTTTTYNSEEQQVIATAISSKSDDSDDDSIIKPYIEVKHEETNTTIILLGCLHGSPSSSKDVEHLLNDGQTDAVVLELCQSRFDILTQYMAKRSSSDVEEEEKLELESSTMTKTVQQDETQVLSNVLENTTNFGTNVATAILTTITALSGSFSSSFQTGLEFITAIDNVDKQNKQEQPGSKNESKCTIVLGDRAVDQTLERMGSLPSLSFEMLSKFFQKGFNWDQTYGIDANVISHAISGDQELKQKGLQQLDMGKVLFRNKDAMMDMARLILPSVILVQFVAVVLNVYLASIHGSNLSIGDILVDMVTFSDIDWSKMFVFLYAAGSAFAQVIFLAYMAVALPASRIIISERDEYLAKAIDEACRSVSENDDDNDDMREKRVVAVLGLIHVNGIAKKLGKLV